MSNRDRVGKGFELLTEGLLPYVDQRMRAVAPGGDWIKMMKDRDGKPGNFVYSKNDPMVLLRVLVENWRNVFKQHLARTDEHFAGELLQVRHRWAHNESFAPADAARTLDTMERLLTSVGAPRQAEQVNEMQQAAVRAMLEAETRKAIKESASLPAVVGHGVKSWRDVLRPHRDVASGDFNLSQFAADLHLVATGGGAGLEYADPVEFFRRTYLTDGLQDLLKRAVARIGKDPNASPVINLQTNFGGGKTHSMLALWHLFSGRPAASFPQEVQDLLGGATLPAKVQRVALVGTRIAVNQPSIKEDGTEVRTMWGELAWQLGGRDAYDLIAESDRGSTSPGDALRELLSLYTPCLILIDEWVAYARQLLDDDQPAGGTFETQFTFAQALTDIVPTVPGAMLVISIPASDNAEAGDTGSNPLEVGGPLGEKALERLQNVVRRVADPWRPASAREGFEIVRRRLFEEPSAQAHSDISAIARHFAMFYANHKGEFPPGCGDPSYEARIKAAYPMHPELFDRLYEDWSTLDRFQRTRGVLRLMSTVVHALWAGDDASPMIMPGSIPLHQDRVLSDLSQYLEDSWKAIIDTDVDGVGSTPVEIDKSRSAFGQRALTRRLARTVFLGSAATLKSAHKGIERQRIWLGVAMPGDQVGNFGSALQLLSDEATYLYVDSARYWYDTQPSVTRLVRDYGERLHEEDVYKEIVSRLTKYEVSKPGDFAKVHPAPEHTGDVPDFEDARLVILHPRHTFAKNQAGSAAAKFAREILDNRGNGQRTSKNTLVFLAPDGKRAEELAEAVRDYLAWKHVAGRTKELNLTEQQKDQVNTRLRNADVAVRLRIAATWIWALVPTQPNGTMPITWETIKADGSEERLAVRTSAKLRNLDQLRVTHAPRLIRADLDRKLLNRQGEKVWDADGHVAVGDLWSYYRQYPYLARLRDRSVLDEGVRAVLNEITWEAEGFALADGYDEKTGRYLGLALPHQDVYGQISDTTLLVQPALALVQREEEQAAEEARRRAREQEGSTSTGGATTSGGSGLPSTGSGGAGFGGQAGGQEVKPIIDSPKPVPKTRFFGTIALSSERYGRQFTQLTQEIIQHLTGENVELEITLEISARRPDGFSDDKIRTVSENARTLKFDQAGFEES
jgi:predicted AAA+ superfamily ATPase